MYMSRCAGHDSCAAVLVMTHVWQCWSWLMSRNASHDSCLAVLVMTHVWQCWSWLMSRSASHDSCLAVLVMTHYSQCSSLDCQDQACVHNLSYYLSNTFIYMFKFQIKSSTVDKVSGCWIVRMLDRPEVCKTDHIWDAFNAWQYCMFKFQFKVNVV